MDIKEPVGRGKFGLFLVIFCIIFATIMLMLGESDSQILKMVPVSLFVLVVIYGIKKWQNR